MSRLVNRNVFSDGLRTSMRLEPELWEALREICLREDTTLAALIQRIDKVRDAEAGRTSTVRVFIVEYFRKAATEAGHKAAGHGSLEPVA